MLSIKINLFGLCTVIMQSSEIMMVSLQVDTVSTFSNISLKKIDTDQLKNIGWQVMSKHIDWICTNLFQQNTFRMRMGNTTYGHQIGTSCMQFYNCQLGIIFFISLIVCTCTIIILEGQSVLWHLSSKTNTNQGHWLLFFHWIH